MAYDSGYTSFFKVIRESTFGTAIAPTIDVLLLDSTGNIQENNNVKEEVGVGSRTTNQLSTNQHAVNWSVQGKVQGGRLFAYAIGNDTVTGSGPYTHTISPTSTLESFTLDKAHINTDKAQRAAGCKINDFSLNLDTNGQLNATFNGLAKDVTQVASTVGTRTQSTSGVFTSWMASISWNSSTIEAKNFQWTYNNNLSSDDYSLGDRRIKSAIEGSISQSVNFTNVFTDFTLYSDFQTAWSTETSNEVGTARSLVITIDNGQSSTSEREITLTFANVLLSEINSPVELSNGRVVQEYTAIPTTLTSMVVKDNVTVDYITNA